MFTRMSTRIAIVVLLAHGLAVSACGDDQPSALADRNPVAPTAVAAGTMFVRGTVSDTAFRHVGGVTIEVLNGPQTGLTTTSGGTGEFSFVGVFDDTTVFRATKDGYALAEQRLAPFCERCNPNRWVHFALQTLTPPADISGNYAMTVTVDSTCTHTPPHVRTRTYAVSIPASGTSSPSNAYFAVLPTGAQFVAGWERFDGGVSGNDVGFWFESLVEEVSANSFLIIGAYASATVSASGAATITAVGSGRIDFCTATEGSGRLDDCFRGAAATHSVCDANHHVLTFTRR
jgi:hypothetical protein